uniref:DNA helicase n=1 Tax=Fopius arisanus TaxID=64838 RepID=A0A0C9QPN2_9HYME
MSSPMKPPATPGVPDDDHVSNNGTPRRQPRTPSSKTPQGSAARETPSKQGLQKASASSLITTPQRRHGSQRVTQETVAASSEGPGSVPASSPNRILQTSPIVGMSDVDLSSPLNYGTPSSLGSIRTPRSGIRGTPVRQRPDIRTDKRIRQVNVTEPISEEVNGAKTSESESAGPQLVIWGTNVVVNRCKEQFKRFIERFIDRDPENDELTDDLNSEEPLYLQKLEEIHTLEEPYLNINCAHLESFDEQFYQQLICYPQEVIPTMDMAANEMFFEKFPAAVLEHQIQVRPFNVAKTKNMRMLNPEDIDQLITISGMVIRTSNVMPEMREAFFRCIVCAFSTMVEVDRGRISEPTVCTHR